MKTWFLILFLLPIVAFAASPSKELASQYQELCAKEQDPVKRQNYCHIWEKQTESVIKDNVFRQDLAVG